MRIALFGLGGVLLACVVAFLILNQPREDRAWLPEYERTATVDIQDDTVLIRNVRDWTYGTEVISQDWIDVPVDPSAVKRVWFIIEPFGSFEGIGHTFLSFEFTDGTALSFSVQARQEIGESYAASRGLFNTYELAYQWGTERDFIARRAVFLQHELRMYEVTLTPDDGERLLRSVLEETNALAEKPRFYNTLTANCTNMLAKIVNKHYPDRLPYDFSWNLTGYSDRYLMQQGLIEMTGTMEETQATYNLTPHRERIRELATDSAPLFSAGIRALIAP